MSYKVLLLRDLNESGKNLLKENGCEVCISTGKTEEDHIKEMADVDALFVRNELVTPAMMDAAPKLKVIAKHGIGYDNIDVAYATKKGIQVVYAPRGNIESVADMAMMMVLGCARRLRYTQQQFTGGNYDVRFTLSGTHQLPGMTIGLIGCGNIAKLVAKRAGLGFGMRVIGYDPFLKPGMQESGIEVLESREEVFRQADFISIHTPSTEKTKRSIGMQEFVWMKPTAYLINTSRGEVVREEELIEALQKGEIAGAGLDVFEHEPVGLDNPLLSMDNVIVTPHCSGMTVEASQQLSRTGAEGILGVLFHRPLEWPVNHLM